MHRLHRVLALAVLLSLLGDLAVAWDASAQQKQAADQAIATAPGHHQGPVDVRTAATALL